MNEDLIDAIDEYNAAVDFRNEPWPDSHLKDIQDAANHVVERHHQKFVRQLEATGGGHGTE